MENGAVVLLAFARMMNVRGLPGAMTEEELRQAEETTREEIESECLSHYDVHTENCFEPKS